MEKNWYFYHIGLQEGRLGLGFNKFRSILKSGHDMNLKPYPYVYHIGSWYWNPVYKSKSKKKWKRNGTFIT